MRNIPKEKVTRLNVLMNIKNEKNQMTQSCEAVARETTLVTRNKCDYENLKQKMIMIWALSTCEGRDIETEMPKQPCKEDGGAQG